ncbi:ABC transporter ATP-binding protein [Mucilaginibacter sp. AK015]|uniref:ABC transporter ATP-binding protein n=1 Tax=Mucilaginibacter sp. AK015 TaxID=2723072 RepID=UPI001615C57A|nr:ABC transporter ATP-binding protein [Mucilaginibacter sp. AK015]MBB5396879.1 phospholipid/cholesterol/gamma-HCH transport system ATP-binding protein [Mucilaginibacter sp. AK015]
MDTREPIIVVEHLYKSFGKNKVLKDFNLTVHANENVVVLGKSGSGKSVLIKCIIGLLKPERGSILVFGKNIPELDEEELDDIRVRVGFLFQGNALYDSMTVRENLEFPLRRHRLQQTQAEVNRLVMEALENVGLPHTVDMMPAELSGGMLKRVALARTMILQPNIILYDEPTTGLDPVTAREIDRLIVELQHKYQTASIIITHDMHCVKSTADHVALLLDGQVYMGGTYSELENATDPLVKQFFE